MPRLSRMVWCWLLMAAAVLPARAQTVDAVEQGRKLYLDRNKGNCLACHRTAGEAATAAANVGPLLEGIREKFPDRAILLEAIAEPDKRQADTIMPPYRRHRILTDNEIDLIARYLETL